MRALRERVSKLEEEVRQLQPARFPTFDIYSGIHLTGNEAFIIAALLKCPPGKTCSKSYLLDLRALVRPDLDDVQDKAIEKIICRVRKKLKILTPPVEIKTELGAGYYMTSENKALLRARKETI